jgi:hypothetical protein
MNEILEKSVFAFRNNRFGMPYLNKINMRKIYLITILTTAVWFSSCKKYVQQDQVSPNNPVTAGPSQFLLVSEVATFESQTTNLNRIASILTQQTAGTNVGQFQAVADYVLKEGDNQDDWYTVYADALVNTQALIDKAGTANPYYRGMGEVLKAMNLGIATDTWGDVPEKSALKGAAATDESFNPPFDKQQDIYTDIQNLLTAAITDLSKPTNANLLVPGSDDLIHQGNVAAWIENAWVLKARYDNRLSKKDASGSATNALTDLTNGKLTDGSNDMNAVFSAASNSNVNPWNAFASNRAQYVLMAKPFIDRLNATNDPRLSFYAAKDTGGKYSGTPVDPDSTNTAASDIGTYIADVASPIPMVTFTEAKFIEAEANFRLGNKAAAATAYNDAVSASVLKVTGSAISAAFKATTASETAATISLEKIMTQKYIAMFGQFEVWNDYRRTNLPKLNPNAAGVTTTIPNRLPTVLDERVYNKNAVVVEDVTQPVWWEQ